MRVRLDKIKFKKGLLSKSRKVTGKIDINFAKLPLNHLTKLFSNFQYKPNKGNCIKY